MTYARELARNFQEDRKGTRRGQRTFYVDVRPDNAAVAFLESQHGTIDSSYPDHPDCVCDSISPAPHDDGIGTEVTLLYSNDKSYELLHRTDKDDPNFLAYQSVPVTSELVIPYAMRRPAEMPGGNIVELWYGEERSLKLRRHRVSVQVTVLDWSLSKQRLIDGENGRIHKIPDTSGISYQFEGGTVSQRINVIGAPKVYDVTYTWLSDPGTPAVAWNVTTNPNIRYPTDLERPPFHNIIIDFWADPNSPPHFAIDGNGADFSKPNGWQSLPGMHL